MATVHIGPVTVARSFPARTIGLIGRSWVTPMLFPRCHSIHTFFMRLPVDIVCLDRDNRVVRSIQGVRPWRVVSGGRRTQSILELPAGSVRKKGLGVGDQVEYLEKATR